MERVSCEGDMILIVDTINTTGIQISTISATMTGNMTFVQPSSSARLTAFLDPNGADRTYNPSGAFTTGTTVEVANLGDNLITLDSTGRALTVPGHGVASIHFDGTNWY